MTKYLFPLLPMAALLLLGLSPFTLSSQVFGTVSDENGEPLPYASVYVRNTTQGTAANTDGEYRLALEQGTYSIVFQYIGYKQKVETVVMADKPVRLNVQLEPSDLEISEVVITTEDPANGIMRKAIAKRSYYKQRIPGYACDVYIKGFYKLLDAPKKVLGQEVGDIGGILDSNRTGVLYLSESVSKLYVQAKPLKTKEVMISSKVSGSANGFSLNRATLTDFNLYDERIEVEREILSPLADNAFSYYRFRLVGRYKDDNGYDIYKIAITPKNDETPTFQGHVYIVDEWWNLAGVDLKLTGKAIQQPVLDTLRIQQEFVLVNKPDQWCLLSQNTGFEFAVLGFKVKGFFNGIFSNYDLKPQISDNFFDREVFKVDKEATERDSAYWSSIRPIPLTEEESLDYVRKDSLSRIWKSEAFLDSMDRKSNRFRPTNLIFGYTWRNSYKRISVSYPALFEGLQFNTVQGWLLNLKPTFTKSKEGDRSRWRAEGQLNYGFSEKRLRGGLRLERRFESIFFTRAELAGGLAIEQFDPDKQIPELTNLLYSLLARQNYMKLYEKAFVRARVGRYVVPGLFLDFSAEYADRRPLRNHSDYSLYKGDRVYSPNLPLPVNVPEENFFEPHKAFLLELVARIRIGETYSSYPNFRSYHASGWPDLILKYTAALPRIGGSVVDFHLIQARLRKSDLSMGLFGYSEINLGGGVFLQNNRVEFMDYFHPKGNQTILGEPGAYARSFFLLPYYEFSTADAFAYAHWRHHFNGWILDRLPGLRKLNWKEAVGFNVYYADQYPGQETRPDANMPYWELSFGFYNIGVKVFRPLHIDLAVGFMAERHHSTGIVLGLDL